MKLPRSALAVVGVAVASLFLSGCGASVGIHPGAAAVVGDESVSLNKVDTTTTRFCQAYLPTIQQSSQSGPVALKLLRQFVALSLTQRLLGEQLAAAYDVEPTKQYDSEIAQIQSQFAKSKPELRAAVLDVNGGSPYLQTVQVAIGRKLDPTTDGDSNKQLKAALQRGRVATQDWLGSHDIHLDPVFGIAVDGGLFKPTSDQTSYALSTLASQGAVTSGTPASSYTDALPASQVCG